MKPNTFISLHIIYSLEMKFIESFGQQKKTCTIHLLHSNVKNNNMKNRTLSSSRTKPTGSSWFYFFLSVCVCVCAWWSVVFPLKSAINQQINIVNCNISLYCIYTSMYTIMTRCNIFFSIFICAAQETRLLCIMSIFVYNNSTKIYYQTYNTKLRNRFC